MDIGVIIFTLRLAMWLIASFLLLASLRLIILTSLVDRQYIKQRLTAWTRNLNFGFFLILLDSFFFNIAIALRLIIQTTETEEIFIEVELIFLMLFETILFAVLLVLVNVIRGGGSSVRTHYSEVTNLIDSFENSKGDDVNNTEVFEEAA